MAVRPFLYGGALLLAAGTLIAGCGGGGGGSSAIPSAHGPTVTVTPPSGLAGPLSAANISLKLPAYGTPPPAELIIKKKAGVTRRPAASRRRPMHQISNDRSVIFTVTSPGPPKLAGSVDIPGGQGVSFVTISLPQGADTIQADLYDSLQAGCQTSPCGTKLASGSTSTTISGSGSNNLNITMHGIINEVCAYVYPGAASANSIASTPLYITPLDPDGNAFGDPAFVTPIQVSITAGGTGVVLDNGSSKGSTVTVAGSNTNLNVEWSNAPVESAAIQAMNGASAYNCFGSPNQATLDFGGPYMYVSDPANNYIWVIDQNTNTQYAIAASVGGGQPSGHLGDLLYVPQSGPVTSNLLLAADPAAGNVLIYNADSNLYTNFVHVGSAPFAMAQSMNTLNKVYVSNFGDNTVSIIDVTNPGAGAQTITGFDQGAYPTGIDVQNNSGTDIAYVGERFLTSAGNYSVRTITNFGATTGSQVDAAAIPGGAKGTFLAGVVGLRYDAGANVSAGTQGSLFVAEPASLEAFDLNAGMVGGFQSPPPYAEPFILAPNTVALNSTGDAAFAVGGADGVYDYTFNSGTWYYDQCTSANVSGSGCGSPSAPAEHPIGVAWSADGNYVWTANYTNASVSVVRFDPGGCNSTQIELFLNGDVTSTPYSIAGPPPAASSPGGC